MEVLSTPGANMKLEEGATNSWLGSIQSSVPSGKVLDVWGS
jgi:hypothetical protein